jgi:peptide/nickel transport system substrate-binding protein
MSRTMWLGGVAAMVLAQLATGAALAQQKTLKFIPQADLRILDPIWTTQYIVRNHGYLIYDTLFAQNDKFEIKPQMVERYSVSDDKKLYTFTLRDGLRFHDGGAVTPKDVIPSLERWGKKDALGILIMTKIEAMTAVDDKTFTIALKEPFPLLLDGLSKVSSNVPFIMPERVAKTDANEQIKEVIGSGPFKFVREEWVPGSKAVYVKNTDYKPRAEASNWATGGKVVHIDRLEWLIIPDTATAAAALEKGEVDWWEVPPSDFWDRLSKVSGVRVIQSDPLGNLGVFRFNHLHPPFDNAKAREALLYAIDQDDYIASMVGDVKNGKHCYSYFGCGVPMETEAGAEPLKGKRDLAKAKALLKESGYNGEKVVLISPTDQPVIHAQSLMTTELLKSIGVNVELQAMDWGTMGQRRARKEAPDKGGWNVMHTWTLVLDQMLPPAAILVSGGADKAWFGWPTNPKIEQLRNIDWVKAGSLDEQKKIVADASREAYQTLPWIITGQFFPKTAFRANVSGVPVTPVVFFWGVDKK